MKSKSRLSFDVLKPTAALFEASSSWQSVSRDDEQKPGCSTTLKKCCLLIPLFFLITGCKRIPPPPPLPIQTIAILPFDSESNDVNAPDIMQQLVYAALKPSVYQIQDIDKTNQHLEKVGIRDGGQLAVVNPTKLGKDLAVHALIFGYVESFGYTNIGFYSERKVKLNLKLVEVATGSTLWENTGGDATRALALDKDAATKAFVSGLADKLVDKVFKNPLEKESKQSVIQCLRTLPGYSFLGFVDKGGAAQKSNVQGITKQLFLPKPNLK